MQVHLMQHFHSKKLETIYTLVNREMTKVHLYYEII